MWICIWRPSDRRLRSSHGTGPYVAAARAPSPRNFGVGVRQCCFEEEWDPYAVTPEDALDVARREVKRWRLEQLTHLKADADLDPRTAFFVLAWDAFRAPQFSYDEALKLARAVGVDLDRDVVRHLAAKVAAKITLWDSSMRAAKGTLGPVDGSRGMIDAIHHAAHLARIRSLAEAVEMLDAVGLDQESPFCHRP